MSEEDENCIYHLSEVHVVDTGAELDVKRLRLPGVVLERNCPFCGGLVRLDLNEHYLSYPKVGVMSDVTFYCDHCDDDWEVPIKLEVMVTEVDESEKYVME